MKNILGSVIEDLNTKKTKYCRIKHKRGWLEYLEDGDLVFKPQELHEILRRVIDTHDKRPRGGKLLSLYRKTAFTIKEDKTPYRPEEALERFIIISNPDNFHNQIPIGGRKESIDIGLKENDSKLTFVELKPWKSANSPLYAIVESLKNLIEYRVILERNINHFHKFDQVELMMLAPEAYYMTYNLIDENRRARADKISLLRQTLNSMSSEFQVSLSFRVIELNEDSFLDVCRRVYDDQKIMGQGRISLSANDSISVLARDKWRLLVSSG